MSCLTVNGIGGVSVRDRDITKEDQRAYEQEQKRSARTGKIRVIGVIAFDVLTSMLYLFAGTKPLYIRLIMVGIQCLIAVNLIYGHRWARVLFMFSAAVTIVRSGVLFSAVRSAAVAAESSHGFIYFACAMGIAGPLLYIYMMWFNKNVDDFFRRKNSSRKR
ncbi:MAG: hypothetical protein IJ806_07965 [Ruminococcus sp.]|nr:hypothetical protein [Ruminococcus sp.]